MGIGKRNFLVPITCLFLTLLFSTTTSAQNRPLIFIPGTMGSKLCDSQNNVVWGDRYSYTGKRLEKIKLPYKFDKNSLPHKACGLIDRINIIPLFWESDVYSSLKSTFGRLGYKNGGDCQDFRKGDIVEFSYDWRLSNFDTADLLKECIHRQFPDPKTKIDIVAHSMGGVIARIYLQLLGGDKRVHNIITLGTPHLGSAIVFNRLTEGLENWPDALSGGLKGIQQTILSFPSTYQLLPSYDNCCAFSETGSYRDADYFSAFDHRAWAKFSWLPSEFRSGEGAEFLRRQLQNASRLHREMKKPIFRSAVPAPPIFVANGFLKTWSRVYFDPATGGITGHTEKEGDKTVLLYSATNGDPRSVRVSDREHEQVFVGRAPALVLETALADRVWTGGSGHFGRSLNDARGRKYYVHSIKYDAKPRILTASDKGSFDVQLFGDDNLRVADLSNISTKMYPPGQPALELKPSQDIRSQQGTTHIRKLGFIFKAPSTGGPLVLELSIDGIAPYRELVLVVAQ